jgi:hypothetical protein
MPATGAAVALSPLQPKAIRLPMMLHNSYKGTFARVTSNGFQSYYIEMERIRGTILRCFRMKIASNRLVFFQLTNVTDTFGADPDPDPRISTSD